MTYACENRYLKRTDFCENKNRVNRLSYAKAKDLTFKKNSAVKKCCFFNM